jgi:hypothetical protein
MKVVATVLALEKIQLAVVVPSEVRWGLTSWGLALLVGLTSPIRIHGNSRACVAQTLWRGFCGWFHPTVHRHIGNDFKLPTYRGVLVRIQPLRC